MCLTLPCYPVCQPAKILLARVSRVSVRVGAEVRVTGSTFDQGISRGFKLKSVLSKSACFSNFARIDLLTKSEHAVLQTVN